MTETELAVAMVEPRAVTPQESLMIAYHALVGATAGAHLAEAALHDAEYQMLKTPAGQAYLAAKDALARAEEERSQADCEVRLLAEECYALDGNKHPHLQVSIRVNSEMQIAEGLLPEGGLLAWAREHDDLGLIVPAKVDMKKFERYARAVKEVAPLLFVGWRDVPVVAIKLEG